MPDEVFKIGIDRPKWFPKVSLLLISLQNGFGKDWLDSFYFRLNVNQKGVDFENRPFGRILKRQPFCSGSLSFHVWKTAGQIPSPSGCVLF